MTQKFAVAREYAEQASAIVQVAEQVRIVNAPMTLKEPVEDQLTMNNKTRKNKTFVAQTEKKFLHSCFIVACRELERTLYCTKGALP